MLKRIITGLLLVGLLVGFMFLRQLVDPVFFDVFIIVIMSIAAFEMAYVFKEHFDLFTIIVLALFLGLLYPAYRYMQGTLSAFGLTLIAFLTVAIYVVFNKNRTLDTLKSFAFVLIYPVALIFTMFIVNGSEYGLFGILLIFAISAVSDTFAYFTGRLIGGKKLCPRVSPKKTVAGAIGGLFGGIAASIAIFYLIPHFNEVSPISHVATMVAIGVIGSVATQVGDLLASVIKRSAGVKDYGKVLPGHGGVMDRIDGSICVSLVVFIVLSFCI